MDAAMLATACAQMKISDSVIELVAVDVMHDLATAQMPAKMLLQDGAVFVYGSAASVLPTVASHGPPIPMQFVAVPFSP